MIIFKVNKLICCWGFSDGGIGFSGNDPNSGIGSGTGPGSPGTTTNGGFQGNDAVTAAGQSLSDLDQAAKTSNIVAKVIGMLVDFFSLSMPITSVSQIMSKTITGKTLGQHLANQITANLEKGMSESEATTTALGTASALIGDTDAGQLGGPDIKKQLSKALSTVSTQVADTTADAKDDSRKVWDEYTDKWFGKWRTGKDANKKLGYDEHGKEWEAKTGKSWDMTTAEGRRNWDEWQANTPVGSEAFKNYAKRLGLTEKAASGAVSEALRTTADAETLYNQYADHNKRMAEEYKTNINTALDTQDTSLGNLQQELKTSKDQHGTLLSNLVKDIQDGTGVYAPTKYSIAGTEHSFLNKGARNTANILADLSQQGYLNTSDYVNKSADMSKTMYDDRAAALDKILSTAGATNPAAGPLAYSEALGKLAGEEETRRQSDITNALDKLRIDAGISINNRQLDQNEPGWIDMIKGVGTASQSLFGPKGLSGLLDSWNKVEE